MGLMPNMSTSSAEGASRTAYRCPHSLQPKWSQRNIPMLLRRVGVALVIEQFGIGLDSMAIRQRLFEAFLCGVSANAQMKLDSLMTVARAKVLQRRYLRQAQASALHNPPS